MNHAAPIATIPERLKDPQTGRILFCSEAVNLMIERLERDENGDLKSALRGFESIFDKLFRNLNFSGVSFVAQDLRGMDFSGAAFRGSSFDHAMIEQASFRGALVDRRALTKAGDWPQAVAHGSRVALDHQGTNRRPIELLAPLFESWAPFSEAHHLPEFVMLPPNLPADELGGDLRNALRSGRVAICRFPVLRIELACLMQQSTIEQRWKNATGKYASDEDRAWLEPCEVTRSTMEDYLELLNTQFHADHRLVPFELLETIHQAATREGVKMFRNKPLREFAINKDGSLEIRGSQGGRKGYNTALVHTQACFRVLRVFKG